MERAPILFQLYMRDDDEAALDKEDRPDEIASFFEAAKLQAAVGSESAERFKKQVAGIQPATGAATAEADEVIDDGHRLEKRTPVFRKGSDGSYFQKSPNGKWLLHFSSTNELLDGHLIQE